MFYESNQNRLLHSQPHNDIGCKNSVKNNYLPSSLQVDVVSIMFIFILPRKKWKDLRLWHILRDLHTMSLLMHLRQRSASYLQNWCIIASNIKCIRWGNLQLTLRNGCEPPTWNCKISCFCEIMSTCEITSQDAILTWHSTHRSHLVCSLKWSALTLSICGIVSPWNNVSRHDVVFVEEGGNTMKTLWLFSM